MHNRGSRFLQIKNIAAVSSWNTKNNLLEAVFKLRVKRRAGLASNICYVSSVVTSCCVTDSSPRCFLPFFTRHTRHPRFSSRGILFQMCQQIFWLLLNTTVYMTPRSEVNKISPKTFSGTQTLLKRLNNLVTHSLQVVAFSILIRIFMWSAQIKVVVEKSLNNLASTILGIHFFLSFESKIEIIRVCEVFRKINKKDLFRPPSSVLSRPCYRPYVCWVGKCLVKKILESSLIGAKWHEILIYICLCDLKNQ